MYDVISLPAGPTQITIGRYLVHAHPHPRPYRPARLIALRQSGGIMHRLYRTEREIVLSPHEALAPQVERLSCSQQERILAYIEERRASFGFDEGEEYKFYLLEVAYELRHLPRTDRPIRAHTYYQLDELLSGRPLVLRAKQTEEMK